MSPDGLTIHKMGMRAPTSPRCGHHWGTRPSPQCETLLILCTPGKAVDDWLGERGPSSLLSSENPNGGSATDKPEQQQSQMSQGRSRSPGCPEALR